MRKIFSQIGLDPIPVRDAIKWELLSAGADLRETRFLIRS
jgi:hypothetical protein